MATPTIVLPKEKLFFTDLVYILLIKLYSQGAAVALKIKEFGLKKKK